MHFQLCEVASSRLPQFSTQLMSSPNENWLTIGGSVLALQRHTLPKHDSRFHSNGAAAQNVSESDNISAALSQLKLTQAAPDDAKATDDDVSTLPKLAVFSLESLVNGATSDRTEFFINTNPNEEFSWKFPSVPSMLQALHAEGYDITLLASLTIDSKLKDDVELCQKQRAERLEFEANIKKQRNESYHGRGFRPNQRQPYHNAGARSAPHAAASVASATSTAPVIIAEPLLPKYANFLLKIDTLVSELNIPISVYVSTAYDVYAIPARGMFDLILDQYYDLWAKHTAKDPPATLIDPALSFYVGERSGGLLSSSDHGLSSSSDGKGSGGVVGEVQYKPADDRAFAHNIGLSYLKPALLFNATSPVERGQVVANADKLMQEMEPAWKYYGYVAC